MTDIITMAELKDIWEKTRDRAYEPVDDMLKVKSVQKKFRSNFGQSTLNLTEWTASLGTGGTLSVVNGTATLGSGTVINNQASLLSSTMFTVPFKLTIGLTLSQRIANQTFLVEAVSVDPVSGQPDGAHCAALMFDGTSATLGRYRVQNSGSTPLDSGTVTMPTTAVGSFYEIEPFADECWFHGGTLDSAVGRASSFRRHLQTPDPNAFYKIRVRWLNGGVAPASNTNAVIQYLSCYDYAELTAEITSGRGQTVAGQGIGVNVISMPTTNVISTPLTPTANILNSAATTNATLLKSSAGTLYSITASNISASPRFLKIYNLTTAPTVGTSIPVLTFVLPANSTQILDFGSVGMRLTVGISLAITGAAADTDTTAILASEVKVLTSFV